MKRMELKKKIPVSSYKYYIPANGNFSFDGLSNVAENPIFTSRKIGKTGLKMIRTKIFVRKKFSFHENSFFCRDPHSHPPRTPRAMFARRP